MVSYLDYAGIYFQHHTYQPTSIARHSRSQDGVAAVWGHSAIYRNIITKTKEEETQKKSKSSFYFDLWIHMAY